MAILGEPALIADIVDPLGPRGDSVVSEAIVPMWRQRLRIFTHNKLAIASVVYLVLILLFCYVGPIFYHTNQTNQATALSAVWNAHPSASHLLGTDSSGFDELGRIMYGGEYSLTLGMLAGLITILVGTIYGMVSGFVGGAALRVLRPLVVLIGLLAMMGLLVGEPGAIAWLH